MDAPAAISRRGPRYRPITTDPSLSTPATAIAPPPSQQLVCDSRTVVPVTRPRPTSYAVTVKEVSASQRPYRCVSEEVVQAAYRPFAETTGRLGAGPVGRGATPSSRTTAQWLSRSVSRPTMVVPPRSTIRRIRVLITPSEKWSFPSDHHEILGGGPTASAVVVTATCDDGVACGWSAWSSDPQPARASSVATEATTVIRTLGRRGGSTHLLRIRATERTLRALNR